MLIYLLVFIEIFGEIFGQNEKCEEKTFSSQWWSHSGSTLSNCLNMLEFCKRRTNYLKHFDCTYNILRLRMSTQSYGQSGTFMWKMKSFLESSLLLFASPSTCPMSSLDSWAINATNNLEKLVHFVVVQPLVLRDCEIFFDGDFSIIRCVGFVTEIHQS